MKLSEEMEGMIACMQEGDECSAYTIRNWMLMARKMENDLIQIHTYTPCSAGCGKSVRYSYSVGPGMCPDCAWKEIQESRKLLDEYATAEYRERGE